MATPPWARPWRALLHDGRSSEEQLDLLDRAQCLTPKGRAERPRVIALIEQTARQYTHRTWDALGPPPTDWDPGSVSDAICAALVAAGYSDRALWRAWQHPATADQLGCIIAEHRAARAALRGDPTPTPLTLLSTSTCPRCQRLLPSIAHFCGYCGGRLGQTWFMPP